MATPEFVTEIKHHWPADRLTMGFESYWTGRFSDWPAQRVADAVRALKIESDPYAPTCEAVENILRDWGICPVSGSVEAQMTRDQQAERRMLGEQYDAQHRADDALCEGLADAVFERVALQLLREDGEEIARLYAKRPLRSYRSLRGRVATYCRENGIVSSSVMKVA